MALLSQETEQDLLFGIFERVDRYIDTLAKHRNPTGLIPLKVVCDELEVKPQTLKRWEELGLRRYSPPTGRTKSVFYRDRDLLKFLSSEER